MTQAVVARKQGDDFQARLFWLNAALLLDPRGSITRVAFETGPKAFDDVLIEYDAAQAPQDHRGRLVLRDHLQCKWHVRSGEFGYGDLVEPAFIGAQAVSLLQRAHEAQLAYAPRGEGARFKLITNWRLKHKDPLVEILLQQWHALDLDRLFDGTTDASAMGRLRKTWREHLQITDEALAFVARTLGIAQRLESGADLRDRLNDRLAAVGLLRVPDGEAGFFYDDLVAKLHAQGRKEFDRESFRELCHSERLFDDAHECNPTTVGVRSFMHSIDNLEARCDETLNLVPHFDGRYIRDEVDWNARLLPELKTFVLEAARNNDHLRLVVDAHVSLAFAIGSILNVKSGKRIEIEQRTFGRRFWSPDDVPDDPTWPDLEFETEITGDGPDLAVSVGLTHEIASMVRGHVEQLPSVGILVHARPQGGASLSSVRCGRHAVRLAEAVTQTLRASTTQNKAKRRIHLFMAGPNAFAFFLGQSQKALGSCAVYEWDLDESRGGGYSLGVEID